MEFIDILIYILAILGLMFTMISIIETHSYTTCMPYYIDSLKKEKDNEIVIKIRGFEKKETNNIIEKIKDGKYNNIYDIADSVKIIKYN